MSHFKRFIAVAIFAACSLENANSETLVREGELVVKLANHQTSAARASALSHAGVVLHQGKNNLAKISVTSAARISSSARSPAVPYDASIYNKLCADLKAAGTVEYCSPNFIVHSTATPNDTYYSQLAGMKNMGASSAWNLSTGSSEVVVAVLDTGVDYTHPDLTGNMWVNPGEIANNSIDDDNNGYIDDVHGINAILGTGDPMDDNEHGTHVAGTIGAVGNNNRGVSGVCWSVQIMGVKFLDSSGSGDLYDAVTGIQYAVAQGARAINASWGGYGYSATLEETIRSAGDAGVLFLAAAGNEANNTDSTPHYPSALTLSNIISVAATEHDNSFASSFSNYGSTSVDVAATGVDVLSTIPGGSYANFSGTSMATPHVTGLAALMLSVQSGLTVAQLKSLIMNHVTHESSLTNRVYTGGYINASESVAAAAGTTPSVDESVSYSLQVGPYNASTDTFSAGKKIKSKCEVRIASTGSSTTRTAELRFTVKNSSCKVGSVEIDPTEGATLSCRAYQAFKGRGRFKLYDDVGNLVAQSTATYAPARGSSSVSISASRLCKKIAGYVK